MYRKDQIPSDFLFLLNFFPFSFAVMSWLWIPQISCLPCGMHSTDMLNCKSLLVVNCCADKASLCFWITFFFLNFFLIYFVTLQYCIGFSLSSSPFLSSWLILLGKAPMSNWQWTLGPLLRQHLGKPLAQNLIQSRQMAFPSAGCVCRTGCVCRKWVVN